MTPETKKIQECKEELKNAVRLVLTDNLPIGGVDILLYHGRSFGDENSILAAAANIIKSKKANYIIIPGDEGERVEKKRKQSANIGNTEIIKRLCTLGVKPEVVLSSNPNTLHTRAETTAFFSIINNRGFIRIGVIAHPHQLPRIILGTINELKKLKIFLPVYSTYPAYTDWEEVVFGSQGKERKPRKEHILDEMIRISQYQQNGDLATFKELTNYYATRGNSNMTSQKTVTDLDFINKYIDKMTSDQIFI